MTKYHDLYIWNIQGAGLTQSRPKADPEWTQSRLKFLRSRAPEKDPSQKK